MRPHNQELAARENEDRSGESPSFSLPEVTAKNMKSAMPKDRWIKEKLEPILRKIEREKGSKAKGIRWSEFSLDQNNNVRLELEKRGFRIEFRPGDDADQRDCDSWWISWA